MGFSAKQGRRRKPGPFSTGLVDNHYRAIAHHGRGDAPVRPGGTDRVIHLIGEADLSSANLKETLDAEVAARPGRIILDMSRLTFMDSSALRFMDSSALRAIFIAERQLQATGGTLTITRPTGIIRRVLEISGADAMLMPGPDAP
jgi:anti-anti-sigma regulatory factor